MDEKDRTLDNYGAIDGTEIFAEMETAWPLIILFILSLNLLISDGLSIGRFLRIARRSFHKYTQI